MADRGRNEAFYQALKQVIIPRKTVVADLGSGTGFLSFLASKLGAKECYLYEKSSDLIKLSQKIAKQNNIKNSHFFNAYSAEMRSPIRADVVISETLGNSAYEEHIIEIMNDAKRFLKPGGIILPQRLRYFVAPVIAERIAKNINPWDTIGFSLNFDAMKDVSLNNLYVKTLKPNELLDNGETAKQWDKIDFTQKNNSLRQGSARWKMNRPATIFGVAIWWECDVLPKISISTSPLEAPTHWEQIFLPALSPLSLQKNDTLNVSLYSNTGYRVGIDFRWEIKTKNARQKMDLKKGWIT
ncbi:methyltransferase domain-containing protein [Candidatus Peregrinibacteria bacterium]|nr:methyltransferase domain-containing protein [Candidatus Peregrinibacteria bacterium]